MTYCSQIVSNAIKTVTLQARKILSRFLQFLDKVSSESRKKLVAFKNEPQLF